MIPLSAPFLLIFIQVLSRVHRGKRILLQVNQPGAWNDECDDDLSCRSSDSSLVSGNRFSPDNSGYTGGVPSDESLNEGYFFTIMAIILGGKSIGIL